MKGITIFPVTKVKNLLNRARNIHKTFPDSPDGWSESKADPMMFLTVFNSLKIRKGFVLRAYQFCSGGNGNAVVYAMPEDLPLPNPSVCPINPSRFLDPPVPPGVQEDYMAVIEGDQTPWSYLSASLLKRELEEFGAMWHGCDWSTHKLVTVELFASGGCFQPKSGKNDPNEIRKDIGNWKWLKSKPSGWEPRVRMGDDNITVTFHTHSALERERIYRHVDSYKPGAYQLKTRRIIIAVGPDGYIF